MSKPWLLVTPASRGIGFHLASHLLKTTSLPLIATARTAPEALKSQLLETTNADPSRLEVLKLDVTGSPPSPPFHPSVPNSQY